METFLKLEHISKSFSLEGRKRIRAVQDVSFEIARGECLGIVGESGCGKSTLARIIMGVYKPDEGRICLQGKPVSFKSQKDRVWFAKKVQMIFQDPFTSLDPRMTAEAVIGENLKIHYNMTKTQARDRVYELLEMVGLGREQAGRFPHEFSGGQRQRIGIARALAAEPEFLVCDEPISALDISIQSQIMNLLSRLQGELGLTYLFIAHDLNMVRYLSQRIAVMHKGELVEIAPSSALYENPSHPYTKALLSARLPIKPGNRLGGVNCQL